MPQITRIVQQKDQNRVSVYLDGKFAFGVTLESLLSNHLKVGQELSGGQIDTLKEQSNQDKVFTRVLRFVTSRPHSEREIKLWFKKKKVDEVVQGVALNRLTKLGLVDDLAFAKWWIEQRTVFRPKPQKILKYELRIKGIRDEIIEEALGQTETQTDLEIAIRVAEKRWPRLRALPEKEARKKLAEFLARRGFSWETIKKVLTRFL
ncbi:MAG: regulatory protein [Microgenomates group bacterium Gr01-1014_5]|nr:MAG: regulatory protein [Microgenomates group bacterium Gr01-1014_5]